MQKQKEKPATVIRRLIDGIMEQQRVRYPDIQKLTITIDHNRLEATHYKVHAVLSTGAIEVLEDLGRDVMGVVSREVDASITEEHNPNVADIEKLSNTTVRLYNKLRRLFGMKPLITVRLGHIHLHHPMIERVIVELDYKYEVG